MSVTVVSLFDKSGVAVRPWADSGAECFCFDKAHDAYRKDGNVRYIPADLDPGASGWMTVRSVLRNAGKKRIGFAFPPCDDLTSSGAKHFAKKRATDPLFQSRAVRRATLSHDEFEKHCFASMIENPVGMLCTLWRKPDRYWDPCDFGGYLPEHDEHPEWPQYIAPRDAYTKKTGAWLGGGFVFPKAKRVEPEILSRVTKSGRTIRGSRQFMKLGGSSDKTKTIRNMTPRGAAQAFYEANRSV